MLANWSNTYIARLLKADKLLFALLGAWIAGTLYYASRQREEFPFLLYGLYSLKEAPRDTFTTYSINIAGQEIKYSKLRDSQEELISSTLDKFIPLMESGKLQAGEELRYKKWLLDYCNDIRLSGDNRMDIYRISCRYGKNGVPMILTKDLILSYTYAAD